MVLMDSTCLTLLTIVAFIRLFVSTLSNPDGFLNINCGALSNERGSDGLYWISDSLFIKSRNVSTLYPSGSSRDVLLQYRYLSYFTNLEATKYCYQLPVKRDQRYLVRATFSDDRDFLLPLARIFDLLLGEIKWTKVDITNLGEEHVRDHEIILDVKSESLSVCLARNAETENNSYVFISTIELRQLQSAMYNSTHFDVETLNKITRLNFGISEQFIQYPDDPFGRNWSPFIPVSMRNISTEENVTNDIWNEVPVQVLQTAIISRGVVETSIQLPRDNPDYILSRGQYYFALYFCDVSEGSSRNRAFDVSINEKPVKESVNFTSYLDWAAIYSIVLLDTTDALNIVLSPANGSDMGPIINAAEVYEILDIQHMTDPQDVLAIGKIAEALNVPDDWRGGDPCLPVGYSSTGIICSQDNPSRVISINLSNKGLTGNIPSVIAHLTALTELLLGNNSLSGSIPELSSLKNLKKLQLQNNQLTGKIPASLAQLPLNQLFLQNNRLDGAVSTDLIKSGLELRVDPENKNFQRKNRSRKIKSWSLVLIGCLLILIAVIVLFITFLGRCKRRSQVETTNGSTLRVTHSITEVETTRRSVLRPTHLFTDNEDQREIKLPIEFTEDEIKEATNNYSTIIGKGSFGSVFRGRLSGYEVAVKTLSTNSDQGQLEFQNEVTLLSRIHHRNIVNLIGYCKQPTVSLIYEYMHFGTLKDHLYGVAKLKNPLDWRTRLNIALQAAQGLLYLHQGCSPPIIHRDIKCSNILLDRRMCAKVADFGISKLVNSSRSYVATDVKGTMGYLDPEYFETAFLTEKSDVYSFGVVLLEIISGRSPYKGIVESARRLLACGKLAELLDPSLGDRYDLASAWKVAEIAYTCVEPRSSYRPNMSAVVKELEEAVSLELEDNDTPLRLTSMKSLGTSEMPKSR